MYMHTVSASDSKVCIYTASDSSICIASDSDVYLQRIIEVYV